MTNVPTYVLRAENCGKGSQVEPDEAELRVGDPCPECGAKLEFLPSSLARLVCPECRLLADATD